MTTTAGTLLEQLGLHQAAAILPDWLERASREEVSYQDFLLGVLEEEQAARANAETGRRLRQAGFPFAASIEQFDFRFRPDLKRQVVLRYLDPTVVKLAQDFVAVKVDTEGKPADVQVANRFDVTSLPTILFVTPGGRQILRVNGFQGPGKFPRTLERAKEAALKIMGYETVLEKNPRDAAATAALGTHLFEQELFDEARSLLSRATRDDTQEPPSTRRQTRMLLAIIQNYDRKYADAEALLKEGLAIRPVGEDEAKLLFILGRTYMKWGRAPDARRVMQRIVTDYGQSSTAAKAREQLALLGQP